MSGKRRVYAVGYYGMGNFGDDLFADTVTGGHLWPDARIRTWVPRGLGPWSRFDALGQAWRTTATVAGMTWADTVAECGGSVLSRLSGTARLRGRWPGVRRDALGVSVGPFADDDDRRAVLAHLDRMDRVVLRDGASAERWGREAPVGGDLAALSPRLRPVTRCDEAGPTIAVCPSAASSTPVSDLIRALTRAVAGCRPERVDVLALNANRSVGDEARARLVARALEDEGLSARVVRYQPGRLDDVARVIALSGAVWTERLHGAVAAYLCDVPFALVGHHVKCVDFGADIGLDPTLVCDPAAPQFPSGPEAFATGWSLPAEAYRARARSVYGGNV